MERREPTELERAAEMTAEELARIGGPPEPLRDAPPPADTDVPDGIASPADLWGEAPEAVELAMPRGKRAWAHPVDLDTLAWIGAHARALVADQGTVKPEDLRQALEHASWAYWVVACLRAGPAPTDRRIYGPEHVPRILRGGLPPALVKRIVQTSDRISGDEAELAGAFDVVFECAQQWAETLLGRLSEDAPKGLREGLAAFAGFASRMRRRGVLDSVAADEALGLAGK
ncbi:MAG TPA: hypothetical protein PLE61_15305 [Vicinamibacterales bacterium]|nr:hypothetical protein [Vicinamibacterales bacterium]